MSYQVLARKWRPKNFQEMVGQESTLRMLMNALNSQRLHHAYLFTGTRGIGKTTLSRILAKCLNCETGISATPCGTCNICQSIDAGKFLDLIEVDAASRTKVEDTREILDNVQYAPSQGRFKIYLIDEVHMLSGHSFNALLKTLEEPPAHVKFLLATTDPKRLPITVLSRCLQFNLKRVPQHLIAQHLQFLCEQENLSFEISALQLLAKAADGSMRDALSLLDQTIAYCGGNINLQDTRIMLGHIEQDAIYRLLDALANQNGEELLSVVNTLAENAPNFNQVLEEFISALHQISLIQVIPTLHPENEILTELAKRFSPEDTQLYYQIALIGRKELAFAPNPQQHTEMILLRMLAFKPSLEESKQLSSSVTKKVVPEKPMQSLPEKSHTTPPASPDAHNWAAILPQLGLVGLAQAIATHCTLATFNENKIELCISPQHAPMLNPKLSDRIEQALSAHFNRPIKLTIKSTKEELQTPAKQHAEVRSKKQNAALDAIHADETVKKMIDMFDASIDTGSIKAID